MLYFIYLFNIDSAVIKQYIFLFLAGDPIIPATAIEIKVVKYLNPYQMIGYDVNEHKKILVQLSKILPKMVLTNRKHQTQLDVLVENGTVSLILFFCC